MVMAPALMGFGQQSTALKPQPTLRDEVQDQLAALQGGYSPWVGGTAMVSYRSGTPGFDHFVIFSEPLEASAVLNDSVRATIVVKPVLLDAGTATGTSTTFQQGTNPLGCGSTPSCVIYTQTASGTGGEVQLRSNNFGVSVGYSPYGFLVSTVIGSLYANPGAGPWTFTFNRDSVVDTQLSYSGLVNTGTSFHNQIWGGVVANQANVQFAKSDATSGFYLSAGGQYLTGYHVPNNTRIDGDGGAYWRVFSSPENGNLSVGVNFFAMHYAHNQNAFTHGMGGYFSPQGYFLANVPFTFVGHYQTNWHYSLVGGLGIQAFQEDKTPLWPLASDKSIETSQNNAMLPDVSNVGPNYDVRGQAAYQMSPHWFAGGFFSANNTRNYAAVSAGFYVRYMFRSQPSTAAGPTGIFPTDGLRPFTVP